MKITGLEPIVAALPYEHGGPKPALAGGTWATMDTLFVRVETDAGIVGWGEAFGFAACPITATALTRLVRPMCLGRDAGDIAGLMADLQHRLHNFSGNGPVGYALSGLDIALWDIRGKVERKPLYQLLGGVETQSVPAYASLLRYGSPDLVARNAAAAMERGYRRIKLHETVDEPIAAARRVCGPETPLMIDTNCAWDLPGASAAARRLAEHRVAWLEEPIAPANDFSALARLRAEASVPIAAGENLGTVVEAGALLEKGGVDVIQPSVTKIGGITEMVKVYALARRAGVTVAPHSPYFGPGLIATIHLIAALGQDAACERYYCDLGGSPLGSAVDAVDGSMRVPQEPGLGVELDERVLERFRAA
jgi:D-galactarolactone cycloisomerase